MTDFNRYKFTQLFERMCEDLEPNYKNSRLKQLIRQSLLRRRKEYLEHVEEINGKNKTSS